MPIPLIILAAGAILAAGGVALAVSNSRNNSGGDDGDGGNDDGDGGNDETGSLEERLERNCRKHSKNDCFYFDRYVPFGRYHTAYSAKILELKEKDQSAIDHFVEKFRFLKGLDDVVLVRVPSHERNEKNGMELLAKKISEEYGVTDRSGDLIRVVEVEERKKSRGAERYMNEDQKKVVKKSLKLSNPEHLDGKDILLIDDIATTWDTMDCCASVVAEDARPRSIRSLVLGRTNPPRKSK